jgi:hypothetical protein
MENPDARRNEGTGDLQEKVTGAIQRVQRELSGEVFETVRDRLSRELEGVGVVDMDPGWLSAVAEPISRGEPPTEIPPIPHR